MKKIKLFVSLSLLVLACSDDDEVRHNPYLIDQKFSYQLHLSLPEYNQLNFDGNHIVLPQLGLNGVVVFNINGSMFSAFELSDPNHALRDCSRLTVSGTEASCSCDDGNVYEIIMGQPVEGDGIYTMKRYNINRAGDVLTISN